MAWPSKRVPWMQRELALRQHFQQACHWPHCTRHFLREIQINTELIVRQALVITAASTLFIVQAYTVMACTWIVTDGAPVDLRQVEIEHHVAVHVRTQVKLKL
ncbi:hypothetical protein RvY_03545 [Ramazzottius varieornatus]|uniref:Uncharacterized protein n=1 Tax=Ramazzottius varieornatus TaxID=947166 RepID=A0A1D1UNF4_RAMVA|nr:hypothetical protein RvY_03545 [Ramazzottius varieornatus]